MTIEFFVPGEPKAQPRPRAFARKFGNKWMARVYDAGTAEGWKSLIAASAKKYIPQQPIDGAVILTILFAMPRPKYHYRSNGMLKDTAPVMHQSRPDLDNLEKAVMDALTQLGFWNDDAQVAWKHTNKVYGMIAGATIKIETTL